MNKLLITTVVITALTLFGSMFAGIYNAAVTMEAGIKAAYTDSQNILSSYTIKIQEMAQVPTMYKDDLKELYTATMSGRYGEDGSKAMWQWLKEQNPTLDSSMYTRLQEAMEAGRNEFKIKQTALIDRKREYELKQNLFLTGFILRLAGFPKINMDDYKIVLDDKTNASFQSGKAEPIKLR